MDSSQLGPRFKQGQGVDETNLGQLVTPRRWELYREFGYKGSGPGEFKWCRGVAARHRDEIAVADVYNHRVQIFGVDGTYKCQIHVEEDAWAVAFAKQSNRLIVVCKTQVKVFNQDNSLAFQFSTLPPYEVDKPERSLVSVAVREDGNLLVGDTGRKVVTEHSPTGALIRTIPVGIKPTFLAARTNGGLIISCCRKEVHIVHVTDGDVTTLFIIKPTFGGTSVDALGLWSDHSGIYITVRNWAKTCHIHQYDAQGAFLACIAHQGLDNPTGITMTTGGQMAVADYHSVKIYH